MAWAGGRLGQSSGVDWLSTLGSGGRLPGARGQVRTGGSSAGAASGTAPPAGPPSPRNLPGAAALRRRC